MAEFQQVSTHEDAPPPVEGTKEHQDAMVQLAEEAGAVEREDEQPSWLPDKFESPEDMAKAYHELETKLGGSESVTNSDEGTKPPQTPQQPTLLEAKEAVVKEGLDFDKYYNEYLENDTLSEDSFKELNEKGMSPEMVSSWIEGQNAISDKVADMAYSSVGGKEQYNSILEWAGKSLSEKEIGVFNSALEHGTVDESLFVIKSLNAQYQVANGSSPNLMQGSTGGSGTEAFSSLAQMSEAMRNPKYNTDPAYREEVTRKLESSNLM
jgi:hypothetical protein